MMVLQENVANGCRHKLEGTQSTRTCCRISQHHQCPVRSLGVVTIGCETKLSKDSGSDALLIITREHTLPGSCKPPHRLRGLNSLSVLAGDDAREWMPEQPHAQTLRPLNLGQLFEHCYRPGPHPALQGMRGVRPSTRSAAQLDSKQLFTKTHPQRPTHPGGSDRRRTFEGKKLKW